MNLSDFSRREFLRASGLVATTLALPSSRAFADADRAGLAQDAFIWGAPLVLMGRYVDIAVKADVPLNQFVLSPNLATPQTRALGAQVDTLYGLGWLDLTQGPQVIEVPDTNDRYYSLQLLDMYANSFAYIGRRTTGAKAGAFAITPPGFAGKIPDGIREIQSPTSRILVFVRTLVRGERDLPAARAIHSSYTLGALSDYPKNRHKSIIRPESLNIIPVIDLATGRATYFDELNTLLQQYPPLPWDAPNLERFSVLGVGDNKSASRKTESASLLAAAVPAALARIRQVDDSWTANGWSTKLNITNFIRDPLLRAATNLYGPGTQVAEEALYFSARKGPDAAPLSGTKRYTLHFAPGQTPPADAFWSVGLYSKDFYLVDNPINRYSVTDRTEGLRFGADGSLDILIQHEQPSQGVTNWLPAPRDEFAVTIRTYQPRQTVLNRTYQFPPLAFS